MEDSGTERRWGRVLPYTFGGFLCLLAVADQWVGFPWYGSLIIFCAAIIIILGRRRIFLPGISRTTSGIICRYIPWYEGNTYFACLLLPLMGVAMVAAGRGLDNPGWFQFGGIILLAVTPLTLFSIVSMWRRCVLCISPWALSLRLATPGTELTEIRREQIESITPKIVSNGVSGKSLQVAIVYHSAVADSGNNESETFLIGLQFSVRPINLLNALIAWKDRSEEDPDQLLDRIEHILRDRSLVGV